MRYREHPTRRSFGKPDRYFAIRYYGIDGKRHEEGLGWGSEGWTVEQAAKALAGVKTNITLGAGPCSLAAMRRRNEADERARVIREERERAANITVAELTQRYLEWARLHKRSWRTDESRINGHILPAIGHLPLHAVGSARVESLQNHLMTQGLSVASVRHVVGLVRRLYNFAAKTARSEEEETPLYSGANPCGKIQMPRQDNARVRFFSREDAARILEHAKDFPKQRRRGNMVFHDICLLSLMTGMRKGEIQSLEWADVDRDHAVIHIRDAKAGDGIAHLNSVALGMFRRRARAEGPAPSGLVFKGARTQGRVRNISNTFKELLDDLGLNDGVSDPRQAACFHTLRHTFASWLALQGTDIYRIKELMRHKTISQTMRYAHLIPGATKNAVERLVHPGTE